MAFEQQMAARHPLRTVRTIENEALVALNGFIQSTYAVDRFPLDCRAMGASFGSLLKLAVWSASIVAGVFSPAPDTNARRG